MLDTAIDNDYRFSAHVAVNSSEIFTNYSKEGGVQSGRNQHNQIEGKEPGRSLAREEQIPPDDVKTGKQRTYGKDQHAKECSELQRPDRLAANPVDCERHQIPQIELAAPG